MISGGGRGEREGREREEGKGREKEHINVMWLFVWHYLKVNLIGWFDLVLVEGSSELLEWDDKRAREEEERDHYIILSKLSLSLSVMEQRVGGPTTKWTFFTRQNSWAWKKWKISNDAHTHAQHMFTVLSVFYCTRIKCTCILCNFAHFKHVYFIIKHVYCIIYCTVLI